jgi:hypothetical protein
MNAFCSFDLFSSPGPKVHGIMEENLNNKNTPGSHINFLFTSLHINTKTCELIYNKRLHRICYLSPINNCLIFAQMENL